MIFCGGPGGASGTQNSGEPGDTAAKTWVVPASTPGCKVTNGGRITATNGDKGGGLSGLKGLDGLRPSGPGPGSSPGSTTPASGGAQLDPAQTQAVVARYTGSVKRSCWQPALDSRDPSAPGRAITAMRSLIAEDFIPRVREANSPA